MIDEISYVDFGDKRLNRRFRLIIKKLTAKPSVSIPQACGNWAFTKAVYRFLNSSKVKPEIIRNAHIASTVERIKSYDTILAVQDTTNINFTRHPATKGLGILDSKFAYGLKCHSCLAVTTEGVPMGLLHQEVWVRDKDSVGKKYTRDKRPIEEKESRRWITTIERIEKEVPDKTQVIVVGDRESDIYELFAAPRRQGIELLVRGYHNRRVKDEEKKLWKVMNKTKPRGKIKVGLRKKDGNPSRKAVLEVRYQMVEILPPKKHPNKPSLKTIELYVVTAREKYPPKGKKGINWLLVTTIEIKSLDDAVKIIGWYTLRWIIERYHYTLKSGCKIEELQLETADRLERALAIYCIVAWRLLWLTYEARKNPDAPCTLVLESYEWKALYCFCNKTRKPPPKPPTLSESVRLIAKLGGFLGRKGDRHPGVKTIWRGLRRLNDISLMYLMMNGEKDVGNG